jgi:hypothetical protein
MAFRIIKKNEQENLVYGRFILPARYYSGVKSFAQKNNFAITVFAPTVTKEMKSFPLPIIL